MVRYDTEPDLSGERGASNHGRAPQHDEGRGRSAAFRATL